MKRIISAILVCLLVAPPAFAGQKPNKPISWEKTQKLKPGTELVLTVTGGTPTKVRFLFADDTTLVTLKTTGPKLSARVEEFLFDVGPTWRAIVSGGGMYTLKPLRVTQDGVFDGNQKLAELSEVVQQTRRGDALELSVVRHSRHVKAHVLAIVAILAVVGLFVARAANAN